MRSVFLFLSLTSPSFAGMTQLTDSSTAISHLNSSQTVANNLWKKFLNCPKSSSDDSKISRCYREAFSPALSELEYNKQLEFLTLGYEVSELYDCPDKIKKAVAFSKQKNNFLCFKILGNNSALIGQLYFQDSDGVLKIFKLKY